MKCAAFVVLICLTGCARSRGGPACDGIVCTAGHCEVDGQGAPRCVCGAFEEAAGQVCQIVRYDLTEADDTPEGATVLVPPVGPLLADIGRRSGPLADVDHYAVGVDAGHTLRFRVLREESAPIPSVTFEPWRTPAELLPAPWPPGGHEVWVEPTVDTLLTFRVAPATAGAIGPYRVQVDDFGFDPAPDGGPYVSGSSFSGDLLPPGPLYEDHRISPDAGEIVRVSCDGGVNLEVTFLPFERPPLPDSIDFEGSDWERFHWLRVSADHAAWYSCAISTVGYDDLPDNAGRARALDTPSSEGVGFITEFPKDVDVVTVPVTDTHCYTLTCAPACTVSPTSFEASSTRSPPLVLTGEPGAHRVSIIDVGPDDHGDDVATATAVGLGTTTGTKEIPGDVDVFSFVPQPGIYYRFTCTEPTCPETFESLAGPYFAASGSRSDGTRDFRGLDDPIELFLEVRAVAPSYAFALTELGRDDHGDSAANATPLELGVAVKARNELPGDEDFFAISLAPGSYELVLHQGGTYDFTLLDEQGYSVPMSQFVSGAWPRTAVASFEVSSAKRYVLIVGASSGVRYGHPWEQILEDHFTIQSRP